MHTSRQLEVRVVKAVQLGGAQGKCLEPYVVLEVTNGAWPPHAQVDEPSQRKQTRTGSGAQFAWEDSFTMWVPTLLSHPSQAWQTAIQCILNHQIMEY